MLNRRTSKAQGPWASYTFIRGTVEVILPVFWAAAGFHRLSAVAHGLPSGLAVAPKVASAPRGQRQSPLAGNPAQSLPRAWW